MHALHVIWDVMLTHMQYEGNCGRVLFIRQDAPCDQILHGMQSVVDVCAHLPYGQARRPLLLYM